MHKLKVHLTVVLGDLLVSGLGALVALLALFSLQGLKVDCSLILFGLP